MTDAPTTDSSVAQVFEAAEYSAFCTRVALEGLLQPGNVYYVACDPYALPLREPAVYTRHRPPSPRISMQMPEMHIAKLHDTLVCPGQVLVHSDGKTLLVDSFRRGVPKNNSLLDLGPNRYGSPTELCPRQVLKGRHFYLDGRHGRHFGHFLTEVLPRLWAAEFVDLDDTSLLMKKRHFQPWMLEYLRAFGFDARQLVLFEDPVQCEELVIARQGCVLGGYFHPLAQALARRVADYHEGPTGGPRRLYLSRRGIAQRRLLNEERIEAIAEQAGFTTIQPETLSIGEQVRLFAGATHLVWPVGSGGYNALFARQNPRKLVLRAGSFRNRVDVNLNAAIGGEVDFVEGEALDLAQSPMMADWQLDPELFAEALADWLSRG